MRGENIMVLWEGLECESLRRYVGSDFIYHAKDSFICGW